MTASTLSIPEVASELGISDRSAYRLARLGRLPGAFRIGDRRWRVSREAFEGFLSNPAADPSSRAGSAPGAPGVGGLSLPAGVQAGAPDEPGATGVRSRGSRSGGKS